ncbi:uncharacterized protein (DUF849 family) [Actinopolyspora biskrensis]|uniref:Uncharacterized protein (DUF849 family) n=1 Tax=Actinopolyspora biskrensis TaxID=1470178 RepID=A0A852YW26_9ACTN|nr:3-keto-5-aminohexanoate cleavage protein [Actinopolyspora biskrensis]NYH78841.1 uncharacterized protein (DUF849 family) [Actinopolyspora biskrensis]
MTASSAETGGSPAQAGTIITVAVTGAHAKADVPTLPVGSEEVAAAAAACERVGTSVVDLEPRHDTAVPDVVSAVRNRTDLLVRVAAYARSETLTTLLGSGAQVLTCPVDAPADFVSDLRTGASERGLAVHYEVRKLDDLPKLRQLCAADSLPVHVVLVFGAGMPGDIGTLTAAVEGVPAGADFTATGLGDASLPVMLGALAAGGHIRVGMADTLEYSSGVPVRDNAQLAARASGLAKIAQRLPLSVSHVRGLFGLAE